MELNELSSAVESVSKKYASLFGIKRDNDWFLLKIQEELGELTQKYLMLSGKARKKGLTDAEVRSGFEAELADLFCQVLLLAHHNNVDLIENIKTKWLSRLNE